MSPFPDRGLIKGKGVPVPYQGTLLVLRGVNNSRGSAGPTNAQNPPIITSRNHDKGGKIVGL